MISNDTSLTELATVVSEALGAAGVVATLSGGAAVSIYSANRYLSEDLDFVTNAVMSELERVLVPLGEPQSLEQAVLVAGEQSENIDWFELRRWLKKEGIETAPQVRSFLAQTDTVQK